MTQRETKSTQLICPNHNWENYISTWVKEVIILIAEQEGQEEYEHQGEDQGSYEQ